MKEVLQFVYRDLLAPDTFYGALFYAGLFFLGAWLGGRALRLAVERLLERDKRAMLDRTAVNFLAQLAQISVYLFAFVSYAHLVPKLQHVGTAWLTSVGVASVVMGLAAQNTLGNLIAGISLLLYRPFKIGDRLQVTAPTGLESGIVESLNLGYTVLRTADNRRVVIPNSAIASQTSVNLSLTDARVMCQVPVAIGYRADLDKARQILVDLAKQHAKTLAVAGCPVTALGPSSVVLTLMVWCADSVVASDLKCDLLETAKKRFDAEAIEIPYQYQNVILHSLDTHQMDGPSAGRLGPGKSPPAL